MPPEDQEFPRVETIWHRLPMPTCQYGVPAPHRYDSVEACGQPAVWRVEWLGKWPGNQEIHLCQKHADAVEENMNDD